MIVLDTHAWVWWAGDPERLGVKARDAISQAVDGGSLYLSSISVWEVALLSQRGRLELTMEVGDWIATSEALPFVRFLPVNNHIALRSVMLPPPFHNDPADRIIVATALSLNAAVVTMDAKLHSYPHVKTIW